MAVAVAILTQSLTVALRWQVSLAITWLWLLPFWPSLSQWHRTGRSVWQSHGCGCCHSDAVFNCGTVQAGQSGNHTAVGVAILTRSLTVALHWKVSLAITCSASTAGFIQATSGYTLLTFHRTDCTYIYVCGMGLGLLPHIFELQSTGEELQHASETENRSDSERSCKTVQMWLVLLCLTLPMCLGRKHMADIIMRWFHVWKTMHN